MTEHVIPVGWRWARFKDVASVEADLVDPRPTPNAIHIAPNHIESKTGRLLDTGTVAGDGITSPKHRFSAGQILYSKIRPYLAKAVLAHGDGLCSADMYPISTRLEPRYLLRWMLSEAFTAQTSDNQGRTLLPKINRAALDELTVPVPPLNEQRRIVAKLEDLLARSRRAKDALDAIPPLLATLRRSILAAAFRGDLTAGWRAKHPDIEPADRLLARIRVERRRKWEEAELTRLRAKSKAPSDDRWKEKYTEAVRVNATQLAELPDGWMWVAIDELLRDDGLAYGILKPGAPDPNGVPMLRVMDVGDGRLTGTTIVRVAPALNEEFRRTRLEAGDVVLSIMATLGRTMVIPTELSGANVNRALAVLKPVDRGLSDYLCAFFRSPGFARTFSDNEVGTAQVRINLGDLAGFPVPLPPHREAVLIATLLQERMEALESTAELLARTYSSCAAAEQSVFARAFRGELVPQDPNDEPADRLLVRVRDEANAGLVNRHRTTPRSHPER